MTNRSREMENEVLNDDVDTVDEVGRLREDLEAERDARLRLSAEYQNYRRRTEQEKVRAADEGKRELLTHLLSIADDGDLAEAQLDESPEAVAEGVRMIRRRVLEILGTNGVTAFESTGEQFDPERHEAFDVVTALAEEESGIVHEEMRRGYLWNGRLLRPALVVVKQ